VGGPKIFLKGTPKKGDRQPREKKEAGWSREEDAVETQAIKENTAIKCKVSGSSGREGGRKKTLSALRGKKANRTARQKKMLKNRRKGKSGGGGGQRHRDPPAFQEKKTRR